MKLVKYLFVGGVQFVFDLGLFVFLEKIGLGILMANTVSRFSAATLGYFLNRKYTFSIKRGPAAMFVRYWIFWGGMTVASTLLIDFASSHFSGPLAIGLTKFFVESALCLLGFIVSRYWVYTHA
jgi:putative flippase GtrA